MYKVSDPDFRQINAQLGLCVARSSVLGNSPTTLCHSVCLASGNAQAQRTSHRALLITPRSSEQLRGKISTQALQAKPCRKFNGPRVFLLPPSIVCGPIMSLPRVVVLPAVLHPAQLLKSKSATDADMYVTQACACAEQRT